MSEQTHFLSRTCRLEDAALQRAMTIYRDPNAREWLARVAVNAGFPNDARIAIPLGPQPSPAHVILDPKGDVVTCLSEGMVVVDSQALSWKQVEEVFSKLSTLSGADPDPYWTWRRLWNVLLDSAGWLPREAYEVLLRERLMASHTVPILLGEAFDAFIEICTESPDILSKRADRQPKEFRASTDKLLWYLRHLLNLAGDLGIARAENLLIRLLSYHIGYLDVAAGVALGKLGARSFESMQQRYVGSKNPNERADLVRGIAIAAARQPAIAVPTARFLKRIANPNMENPDPLHAIPATTAMIALHYLGAQGGRVASEVISVYFGRSDSDAVSFFQDIWQEECAELHDRWPSGSWSPVDLYLPREESEAELRKGPRPCPEPLAIVQSVTLERTKTKVHRNDPCPCGSGKKAKKCCGTEGKYEQHAAPGSQGPLLVELQVLQRAMKGIKDRAAAEGIVPPGLESEA